MQSGVSVRFDVLDNDDDLDGDAVTVTAVAQPANGSVTIDGGGSGVTYVSNAGFIGLDTFTYTITDATGLTATASVAVTVVAPPNNAPIAEDDDASTQAGVPLIIDVLQNDRDPDLDAIFVSRRGLAANGVVAINPDGTLTYTPNPGFPSGGRVAEDSFNYVVSDGNGGEDFGLVTVTVFVVD